MGSSVKDETKIAKAENYHGQSLQDSSFLVFNIHAILGLGGALFLIMVFLLAGISFIAHYRLCTKTRRARTLVSVEAGDCVEPA